MIHCLLLLAFCLCCICPVSAQQIEIPRRHDRAPNAPRSAEEAITHMTVPEGFSVDVVAAEPDIMNPVAMCIDERGRFWITESFEYPRREAGPGRDRIKILEDTDGDGRTDKVTIFAEDLNIPSGIAVGYGGVWVCNAPDLLFLQDLDGDGRADKSEVVVTGFGRTDLHEVPNSLTWGPDGWLYGLNGVFNVSKVTYPPTNPNFRPGQKSIDFTCALFRIHPRTRVFEVFAEGTSNPWGIAVNAEGEFFLSACVIDHLWHVVETGYYIRQGGPYPPHIWPMPSIVKHKHQKAAYCGIVWFDSPAYPPEYRNVLYMGNIHGGCINADLVDRAGSTYRGRPHPGFPPKENAWKDDAFGQIARTGTPDHPKLADLLTANDAWFMPVSQKVGPDGCLYILDWYDQYHCYQDANADPAGVDRSRGRLYRLSYHNTPLAPAFNLNDKTDDELIALLGDPNIYYRETAQRLLGQRAHSELIPKLRTVFLDPQRSEKNRLCALYAAASCGLSGQELLQWTIAGDGPWMPWLIRLITHDPELSVEASRRMHDVPLEDRQPLEKMSPPVLLQHVIGWSRLENDADAMGMLMLALEKANGDTHLEQVIWRNLIPRITHRPELYLETLAKQANTLSHCQAILARSLPVVCEQPVDADLIGQALAAILTHEQVSEETKSNSLATVRDCHEQGILTSQRLKQITSVLNESKFTGLSEPLHQVLINLNALAGGSAARETLRRQLADQKSSLPIRLEALRTLISTNDDAVLNVVSELLNDPATPQHVRLAILERISRLARPETGEILVASFSRFDANARPKVIEVLTQRAPWSKSLLIAIDAGRIDKSFVNLNQLMRMNSFPDKEIHQLMAKYYGTIRTTRSNRQGVINQKKDFLRGTPGDPYAGVAVFQRICAQCHRLHGTGADVGPDLTRNGRSNWDQLIQNVFDPSAVIGPGYQARIIATEDGRVLTGLPVEESADRLLLKIQGGKLESIPRSQIEADKVSNLSMMPEELEKLMTSQELADLLAYLSLDQPPENPQARLIPGAPFQKRRSSASK